MKNSTFLNSKFLFLVVIFFMGVTSVFAQKEFTVRKPKPNEKGLITPLFRNNVYHLRGNFTMAGNTLMTRAGYSGKGGSGGKDAYMIYVNVDTDNPKIINSSWAELKFPSEESWTEGGESMFKD